MPNAVAECGGAKEKGQRGGIWWWARMEKESIVSPGSLLRPALAVLHLGLAQTLLGP